MTAGVQEQDSRNAHELDEDRLLYECTLKRSKTNRRRLQPTHIDMTTQDGCNRAETRGSSEFHTGPDQLCNSLPETDNGQIPFQLENCCRTCGQSDSPSTDCKCCISLHPVRSDQIIFCRIFCLIGHGTENPAWKRQFTVGGVGTGNIDDHGTARSIRRDSVRAGGGGPARSAPRLQRLQQD